MREGREVAGCAEAPLLRHDGMDATLQQCKQPVDDQRPTAAMTECQCVRP